jgi:hypothetical protein
VWYCPVNYLTDSSVTASFLCLNGERAALFLQCRRWTPIGLDSARRPPDREYTDSGMAFYSVYCSPNPCSCYNSYAFLLRVYLHFYRQQANVNLIHFQGVCTLLYCVAITSLHVYVLFHHIYCIRIAGASTVQV